MSHGGGQRHKSFHTGLRGQTPLFYNGADKERAGCPTIEVEQTGTKYLLVIPKEVVNEREKKGGIILLPHQSHQTRIEKFILYIIKPKTNIPV